MPFRPHSLPLPRRLCKTREWASTPIHLNFESSPNYKTLYCFSFARFFDISHPCFLLTSLVIIVWSPSVMYLWQVSFASSLTSPRPAIGCDASDRDTRNCDIITRGVICGSILKSPFPHFPTYVIAFTKSREVNARKWPLLQRLLIISLVC